ncbi:MAG: 50S ribosomal protein L29 [bacterium]|jgi:ribosomal protein L29|nr:50S ribosomal protein L29 [Candidatus Taylorbacteria bacterium]
MKIIDLKKKTKAEMEKMLEEKKVALNAFKFGIAGSKIKNVREGRNIRREIAQIITTLKDVK